MKKLIYVFLLSLSFGVVKAQHFEAGGLAGVSSYQGDLSPFTIKSTFSQLHPAFGLFVKYNINDFVAVKLNTNFAKVSGNDELSPFPEDMARNLSFRSNILEIGLTGEFNILGYQPYGLSKVFSPFVYGGIAFMKFNPEAQLAGSWVELQPLGTEGQGIGTIDGVAAPLYKYKLANFNIPFGVGVKYALSDILNVGFEMGFRYTFTDYLDDVSGYYIEYSVLEAGNGETAALLGNRSGQDVRTGDLRGNPDNNDWYFTGGITLSYNFLDNGLVGSRRGRRSKQGCNF